MRLSALVLGLIATSSAFAGNFTVDSAYPSDAAGNQMTPRLGEPFWMTVRYQVGSNGWGTMKVSSPGMQQVSSNFLSQMGARQATYGPLVPLYDGVIPVTVAIGDASTLVQVQPVRPSQAIEYFNPQTWQASFGASFQFQPGKTAKVEWLTPKAPSFGFQNVHSNLAPDSQLAASDVYRTLNVTQTQSSFSATVNSVRINSESLRTVGFTSLKKVSNDVKKYLKSETLIETGDRNVKALVTASLPKNFAKTMSVYDAASLLYRAVISRIQYVESPTGNPSAAVALRTGYGDCGFFAAAFSAAARQAGIPARPITGFMAGTNEWHVWAEFYVPGYGWVPVDPSFGDALDPQGQYPLYFGVIPELNQRVATAIGFDHSFGKYKLPILQSPYALTDVKKVASAAAWCSLSAAQD